MQTTNDTRFEPVGQEIDRSVVSQDSSPHTLAPDNFFVRLFNGISPNILTYMGSIWLHFRRRWPWSGTIGLGGVPSVTSVIQDSSWPRGWVVCKEQSWPTADRSISWPNGSNVVPFVICKCFGWLRMGKRCCNLILWRCHLEISWLMKEMPTNI